MAPDPDYVVVGTGLAALAFGALMARAGRRVDYLEVHEHAGGYGHTFEVGGVRFNAQLHYAWDCGEGRVVHDFLRKLDLHETITFERYDPDGYDHMRMPGWALDIPGDLGELARRLVDLFPAHRASIEGFVDEVRLTDEGLEHWPLRLRDPMSPRAAHRLWRNREATLQQVFDRFGLPQPAQALLALQWPDFLLPPAELSFLAWVMLFCGYGRGAFYPTHHFEHVVQSLVDVIERAGGRIHHRRHVDRFLLQGDRVVGVRAEVLGERGEGTGVFEEHRAPAVVANLDPKRAAEMIGLERFSPNVRRRLDYAYSASNFMAYCAVEGLDLRAHGFGRWNVFHAEHPDLNEAFAAMADRGDYSRPSFAITTPGLLTPERGDRPECVEIVEFLTVADHRRFHALKIGDARAYREKKREIFDRIVAVVERDYIPDFRAHLVVKLTGSPTTNEHFVTAPLGNSYGSALTPAHVGPGRLDHRTSIDGLHFCNASSGFPGFAGTIWTGARLYEALSGDAFRS